MSWAYYTTTADPTRADSNHWSNAPEEGCPNCGSTNYFTAKKQTYNFMTRKFEDTEIIVCRECWHKWEF